MYGSVSNRVTADYDTVSQLHQIRCACSLLSPCVCPPSPKITVRWPPPHYCWRCDMEDHSVDLHRQQGKVDSLLCVSLVCS